jgi:hypothetical protein
VKWGRDEMEIALARWPAAADWSVCPCPRYPVNEKKSKSDQRGSTAGKQAPVSVVFLFFLLIRSVSAWISRLFTPQPAAEYYEQFLSNNVVYHFLIESLNWFSTGAPMTGKLLEVRVSNCNNNFPCILQKGTQVTVEFDYIPCNFNPSNLIMSSKFDTFLLYFTRMMISCCNKPHHHRSYRSSWRYPVAVRRHKQSASLPQDRN